MPGSPILDPAAPQNAVGQPMSRVDGQLKVTGRATYAAEHDLPDLLHGVIVSSAVSRASDTTINTDRAMAQPGVLRVLTDFGAVQLGYPADQVNFFGQPLAVVVATSLEQAQHGASLVEVRHTALPASSDMDAPGSAPQPAPETPDYDRGDPDGALRGAPTVLDHTFTIARDYHNPIELPSTIAQWDGDRLTLWDKTQWVQGNARNVATALGVPAGNVRVICPFIGGAFGSPPPGPAPSPRSCTRPAPRPRATRGTRTRSSSSPSSSTGARTCARGTGSSRSTCTRRPSCAVPAR
jgi:xanthine dehydrogenase YagR molybdenum-binding subunit